MERPILLATDGSPSARRATEEAVALAVTTRTPLHAITVYRPSQPSPEDGDLEREHAEFILESVRAEAEANGVALVPHLRVGDAADEILAAAAVHDARMIVVGQHGWSKKAAPGGRVSSAIRHRTEVPVLIVPQPARSGSE